MKFQLLSKFIYIFFFPFITLFLIGIFSHVFAASLLLNPPFGNVESGKDLILDVVLQAKNEKIDGVDVVLDFDSKVLKVKEVKSGEGFKNYSKEVVDGGQVKMSALASENGLSVTKDLTVFTIVFEIYATGETNVDLSFSKGSSTDSNVILHSSSQDVLSEVKSGRYLVTASPEKIEAARRANAKPLNPLPFFLLILLIAAGIAWYLIKKRKPKEDFFVPEPFPLDRPPKLE